MNPTDLQTRIPSIKAECEEILRLSEKARPAPWHAEVTPSNDFVMSGRAYVCSLATLTGREDDFRFIVHARNVSPAMARVVLVTIKNLEDLIKLGAGIGEQYLESIAIQWNRND